jgi:nicotinamide riboside kinase
MMTKILFLCGAQRTGKTTLGQELGKLDDYIFHPVNLKQLKIWERYRYQDLSLLNNTQQFEIQQTIAHHISVFILDKVNDYQNKINVFDRSLIDVIAYCYTLTMNDNASSNSFIQLIENINFQSRLLESYFDIKYILLHPGIEVKEENENVFYSDFNLNKFDLIISSLVRNYKFIEIDDVDLEVRLKLVENFSKLVISR